MTRLDLLKILVGQAHENGFDFRQWFVSCLRLPWQGPIAALNAVESERRYYALLFNHDFAQAFWKAGQPITFQMPAQSFQRTMADGSIRTVERKPFMRRTTRPEAWRYHLREMAVAEDPLRYMRKYLRVEDDLVDETAAVPVKAPAKHANGSRPAAPLPQPPRLGQNTLALARQAAERRRKAVDALPPPPSAPSASKRRARLPGSR